MKRETYCSIIKATGIERGDLVLVQYWMGEEISEDVGFLQAEIAAVGATPMLVIQNLAMSQLINENVTENTYGEKYFKLFEEADVVIDLIERPIRILTKPVEPEKMDLLGSYMRKLFQICTSKKKMLQLRVPTEAMAMAEGMEPEDYAKRMEAAMDIDYALLNENCIRLKEELEKYKGVEITTGNGEYRLVLSFEGRSWGIDAGDGDLPCGEISIAPVESATNGKVFFDTIFLPNSEDGGKLKFEKVVLTINSGVITETSDDKLTKLISEYPRSNTVVCELGLGMNTNVTSLCGCALLDEKMIGTFHLGIGDNTMFSGTNEADDHNDLIGTGEYLWK